MGCAVRIALKRGLKRGIQLVPALCTGMSETRGERKRPEHLYLLSGTGSSQPTRKEEQTCGCEAQQRLLGPWCFLKRNNSLWGNPFWWPWLP